MIPWGQAPKLPGSASPNVEYQTFYNNAVLLVFLNNEETYIC
jgi:hypothetical protein